MIWNKYIIVMNHIIQTLALLLLLFGNTPSSYAAELSVAVASNFLAPLGVIAEEFEAQTRHQVLISSGSTGKLYAQITHGAPFHILLAADTQRPHRLVDEGFAVEGTPFVYAVGRLALWSPIPGQKINGLNALLKTDIRHVAIANPKTAPYGQAAYEVLHSEDLWDVLRPRIVQGENIGQAFQFVASGNAEFGFVALSQILNPKNNRSGSRWEVPSHLHTPIEQGAVLLRKGESHEPAIAFLHFLRGTFARQIILGFGYELNAK